jgi:hypothetical protein
MTWHSDAITRSVKLRCRVLDELEAEGFTPGTKLYDYTRAAFNADTQTLAEVLALLTNVEHKFCDLERPRGVCFQDGITVTWNGSELTYRVIPGV